MDIRSEIEVEEEEVERAADRRLKQLLRKFSRHVERGLRRDRKRLFRALEDFANTRQDQKAWHQFRKRWPRFFPAAEFERVERGLSPSVRDYSRWLDFIWRGYGTGSELLLLLGVKAEVWVPSDPVSGVTQPAEIRLLPSQFFADWDEGVFQYRGLCMFQRALYLLFRESWRARMCEKCKNKFIARRVAQKYCTTDCSESVQRELKLRWWAKHGDKRRREQKAFKSKNKGDTRGAQKTR